MRERTWRFAVVAALATAGGAMGRGATAQAPAPTRTAAGWLYLIWRDARAGTPVDTDRQWALVDDRGGWRPVDLDEAVVRAAGGWRAIDRQRVMLDLAGTPAAEPDAPLRPATVRLAAPPLAPPTAARGVDALRTAPPVAGSQAFVTILCRFPGTPDAQLPTRTAAERITGQSYPGVDHYYREVSNGRIDLAGSVVVGWYTLPHPRDYYVRTRRADLGRLADDCTGAADRDVYFPAFRGINLQFSEGLDCCSWGGAWRLTRDGQSRSYPMTWLAGWALNSATYAHELGHAFGFPHSHGPYGKVYDSKWDIMSFAFNYHDPTWGLVGPHTIAWHKSLVGWIPRSRIFLAPPSGVHTIRLARSARPGPDGYLVAEVPIPGTGEMYTAEARQLVGDYDARLPGEGVIIHRVGYDATVIDADGNGDPNDDGARWTVAETFADAAARIAITIDAAFDGGWRVTIRTGSDLPTLAVTPRARGDTVLVGAEGPSTGSASVVLTGAGAARARWAATSRRAYTTLAVAAGTGSGRLRWARDPRGLAPGVYVDTIVVSVSGAAGSPATIRDTLVVLGPPTIERAAAQLTGVRSLTAREQHWLDRTGNDDGTYDLGDFLALVERSGGAPAAPAVVGARRAGGHP